MAWMKLGGGYNGDAGGEAPFYWYNNETGETSQFDPTPSGQYKYVNDFNDGTSSQQIVDAVTGRPVSGVEAQQATQQMQQKEEADWNTKFQNAGSSFEKVQLIQQKYGIETVAQLAKQGYFADVPDLGAYIAARQREANDKGFQYGNGNSFGLWPVTLGMAAGGLLSSMYGGATSAAAAPTASGVGSTAATQVGMVGSGAAGATTAGTVGGVSANAGAEFTGGLSNTVTGSPGLNAGSFNAASLGTGGTSAAPGLTAPSGLTGAGALSAGSFAGESMYPLIGGMSAATGATGLGTASSGAMTAGQTAAAQTAGGTALSRLLDGTATAADYMSLAGTGLATGLGIYGANQQAKSLEELTGQYMAMGAPSRLRYEGSFAPGFSMLNDPGYKDALDQTTKSFLHKASVSGNPVDSPNAWKQTLSDVNSTFAYPALQNYRSMNANAGGLSRFADAAPNTAMAGVGAQRGVYDAIGYGVGNVFNPPTSLEQLLKQMK